jgi:hypothetical protein
VSVAVRMHKDEIEVDEKIVRDLLRSQRPDLADLPLVVVEPWGTDNAIWRLGTELVVVSLASIGRPDRWSSKRCGYHDLLRIFRFQSRSPSP